MVKYFKNTAGISAKFGKGTVRIQPYILKLRYGGQLQLSCCDKTKLGEEPPVSKKKTPKIILDFSTIESLDVMIEKLQDLREMMTDGRG